MAAGEPQGPADCGGGLHPGLLTLQGDARQGPGRRGGGHSLKQCCGAGAEIIYFRLPAAPLSIVSARASAPATAICI